ncbi:hypothetical protein [Streptomyces sp. NPDC102487]
MEELDQFVEHAPRPQGRAPGDNPVHADLSMSWKINEIDVAVSVDHTWPE